ncbi:universal stress protein [Rhodococcoides kyotonense]|uniref:Nucleotide-binding universal stress protein, UspA family n=1 Tax=Rhodococcoides kyotonense TaxID=398843 RepID=A0A239EI21_9NOCA|nr:universal stress protein [Rhodococcus kyotonensis]SNS43534.1 Nucleotide-binding universal stress protein, UspA family [Rhodococcus kyotonensis]
MTGKNTIVVGIDGSESADRAVVWAARTAASRGWTLRIVIAVDPPAHLVADEVAEFRAVAGSRLVAAEVLARESVERPEFDVVVEAIDGKVVEVLMAESKAREAIVLGASGLGESDSGVLGSSAVALCAHGYAPVVVVRGRSIDGRPPAYGPVVVGVDGSAQNQSAVGVAFDEAAQRNSPLVAVHVWSDVNLAQISGVPREWASIEASEEALLAESLAGWQDKYPDVEVRRVVAQDRPVRVLSQLSEEASLIVVGHRGRGGFTGMLLGSTSYALIHTADCPVMVVRGPGS